MKPQDLIVACAAQTLKLMNERTFDASRRFSEALASHLFVRELFDMDDRLGPRIWLEYRPWPEESDERIDVWVDAGQDAPSIAIELKIGDPTPHGSTEGGLLRGELVADFLKLGTAMTCSGLDLGFAVTLGAKSYLSPGTPLCRLSRDPAGSELTLTPRELIPKVSEQRWAGLETWEKEMTPAGGVPSRLAVELVERIEGTPSSCWVWRVAPA